MFGVGKSGAMNFYKYSPQKERFIGFDQAYASSSLSEEDFFQLLHDSAQKQSYKLPGADRFLGYFLQYKVGKLRSKRSQSVPGDVTERPFVQFLLSTARKGQSAYSQHELLCHLANNKGALVYYACPMIFDREDLYESPPDLDRLKLVDVDHSVGLLNDNQQHSIYFDGPDGASYWASEPQKASLSGPYEFARKAVDRLTNLSPSELADALMQQLLNIASTSVEPRPFALEGPLSACSPSLTIVRLAKGDS